MNKIKVAAISDIHVKETSTGKYRQLFSDINEKADILLLCGDLTDLGLIREAEILLEDLLVCKIPIVAVLGNHDYESDNQQKIHEMFTSQKIRVLDGTEFVFEKNGKKIGFTGVKGFGGGFNPYMWGRFGEKEQKEFYDAIAQEVQHLELGLGKLQSLELDHRFVLLHFAPIRTTVEGDIIEMFPFLGSSRLEEVIDRYEESTVIHGHSHHGKPEGKTLRGFPVYNVAYPIMEKLNPKAPYLLLEV